MPFENGSRPMQRAACRYGVGNLMLAEEPERFARLVRDRRLSIQKGSVEVENY